MRIMYKDFIKGPNLINARKTNKKDKRKTTTTIVDNMQRKMQLKGLPVRT